MRKKQIIGFLLVIAALALIYFGHARAEVIHDEAVSRSAILKGTKPITDKVGSFVWLYAYPKDSKKNLNYVKAQIKVAKSTNLKYVMLPIVFKPSYIKNGKYNYSEFDTAVKTAKDNNLTPIVVFSSDNRADADNYRKDSKSTIDYYQNMIKESIQRYSGRGVIWQMWNEPNGLFWFDQSMDGEDASLVKSWTDMGAQIQNWVREYDPDSVFLAGALAGDYSATKKVLQMSLQDGLADHADAIANHPYLSSRLNNGAPESLLRVNSRSTLQALAPSTAKDKLKKIPLVTTEFGYSMAKTHLGQWSASDQANYLARSIFILDMMHQPIISLYALVDEGNGNNGQWGMYSGTAPNYKPKQSGQLIAQLLSNLNGFAYRKRITQSSKGDYVLQYVKTGANSRYVAWTTGGNHRVNIVGQSVLLSQTPQIVYAH